MRRRVFRLCVLTLALGVPFMVGCAHGDSPPGPDGLLGYWRAPATTRNEPLSPHLILIRRTEGRYVLWAPQLGWGAPLEVHDSWLVLRYPRFHERFVFSQTSERRMALAVYMGGAQKPVVLRFAQAQGSSSALAAELHGWQANSEMPGQVDTLVKALGEWWQTHHRYPPRSALLPHGDFWRWSGAPHLSNAVTGGAMRLGPGAGNFDYSTGGVSRFSVKVHFYGGGDTGQSGS
jgi:hypothetical protein